MISDRAGNLKSKDFNQILLYNDVLGSFSLCFLFCFVLVVVLSVSRQVLCA